MASLLPPPEPPQKPPPDTLLRCNCGDLTSTRQNGHSDHGSVQYSGPGSPAADDWEHWQMTRTLLRSLSRNEVTESESESRSVTLTPSPSGLSLTLTDSMLDSVVSQRVPATPAPGYYVAAFSPRFKFPRSRELVIRRVRVGSRSRNPDSRLRLLSL